jgi:hypothetical protein
MLRKPAAVGALAGALTAVAVFGGTGAFLAVAQDTSDTTAPETTAPETTAPDSTVPETTAPDSTAPETTEPETTAPDTQAPSGEDRQAQVDEWRQCMADHGVEVPEPQVDENGRPVRPERPQLDESQREALEAAKQACGPPPFGRHRHGGRAPVALTDEQRQCMADAGFPLPEPQVDENGRPVRPERPQLDESQREAFRAAAEACGLPIGGPGCGGPGMGHGRDDSDSSEPEAQGSSFRV